ncbi:DNA endonuclease SmrA [Shewanella sp. CG12_big_fil_rev_8_21_14_0_65_47_15]|uniref:DNA endonuclease SmrA n=1 Tax=Shewanella sp. CG12_big_fil_rev_8_21_14_0_65_47_15 TaxID=1975537 RepID=UPI000CAF6FA2|nr:DNA endonuclease SmrA [Shewanella sp. CG12_big_fil_rev_8_21_14_0_65_47_15]PIW60605.1 MAG: DNA endonuclease SmrA [Shewanella sp. CG12_big_fil_rev_8_21_14_0_65_47_15]
MLDDGTALFFEEMTGVVPLKGDVKAVNSQPKALTVEQIQRRDALQREAYLACMPLDLSLIPIIAPDDIVSFKREGVQGAVFKRLRLGQYSIKMELDVHAYRLSQARDALLNYLLAAQVHGERCVMLIHGKGHNSRPVAGLLKSAVCHWLSQLDLVLAYHSAKMEQGGTGALYVMLTKSEQHKLENKEANRKGMGWR